jgi:hypothetical protein
MEENSHTDLFVEFPTNIHTLLFTLSFETLNTFDDHAKSSEAC